jgi:hypothetical protein
LEYIKFKYWGGNEYYFAQYLFLNFIKRNILTLILYFSFYMVLSYGIFIKLNLGKNERLKKVITPIICVIIHFGLMIGTGFYNFPILVMIFIFAYFSCLHIANYINR